MWNQKSETAKLRGMTAEDAKCLRLDKLIGWVLLHIEGEDQKGYRSPLWDFTRYIKGKLGEGYDSGLAWKRVNRIVTLRWGGWDQWRLPKSESVEWRQPMRYADLETEFKHCWYTCNYTSDPVHEAFDRAKKWPLNLKNPQGIPACGHFVSLFGHLGLRQEDGVVALPTHKVADVMGCSAMTISRWIKYAQKEGYLELVREHDYDPERQIRLAAEYRVSIRVLVAARNALQSAGKIL
jgi:hypothetical protein